jgi:potassium/chloride transporter 4/5/6
LLIAYLLKQNRVWRNSKIRIIAVAGPDENNVQIKSRLTDYLYKLRIKADIFVAEISNPEESQAVFQRTLVMEERTKLIRQLRNNQLTTTSTDSRGRRGSDDLDSTVSSTGSAQDKEDKDDKESDNGGEIETEKRYKALDKTKVKKMQTAMRMNFLIKEHSTSSQLVSP